jgi:hypothetical protein
MSQINNAFLDQWSMESTGASMRRVFHAFTIDVDDREDLARVESCQPGRLVSAKYVPGYGLGLTLFPCLWEEAVALNSG